MSWKELPGRECGVESTTVEDVKGPKGPKEGRGRMGRALQGLYSGSFMQVVGDKGSLLFI